MTSTWSVSLNGGLGSEPPAGSRSRAPGGGQGPKPPEAESFLSVFVQKSGRVKVVSEKLPLCLRQTALPYAAMISPKFWSVG